MKIAILFSLLIFSACSPRQTQVEIAWPTPPLPPLATPEPKTDRKIDAGLSKKFESIAAEAKGKVGAAAVVLETGEAATLNADGHFPMQSVYKLPIAMAVMEQTKRESVDLDEKIVVTKDDLVGPNQHSPLRDKNPNGGEFTVRELMRLALAESDGTASDVLMRVAGGAFEIQAYLTQIGIGDMRVANTEKEIGRDWETQYQNWATPLAAVELLRSMRTWVEGSDEKQLVLHKFMLESSPGAKRIKGLLPKGTPVAHKTGTSGTQNGITAATNDIGVIWLPNGKHLAVAVFVSDSPADEKTREAVIAKIAKAAWDKWSGGSADGKPRN